MESSGVSKTISNIDNLLNEADSRINTFSESSVIFLGNAGHGKTTLLSYIAGKELKVITGEELKAIAGEELKAIAGKELKAIAGKELKVEENTLKLICNDDRYQIKNSGETYTPPNRYDDTEGNVYWDCSGFTDRPPDEQEFASVYNYNKIWSESRKIKIVLVIKCGIWQGEGNKLISIFDKLLKMIPSKNKNLERSETIKDNSSKSRKNKDKMDTNRRDWLEVLSIVITHCDENFSVCQFREDLYKIAQENKRCYHFQDMLFEIVDTQDKICLFTKPSSAGIFQTSEIESILSCIQTSESGSIDLGLTLKDSLKHYIRDLMDLAKEKFDKSFQDLIDDNFVITETNQDEIDNSPMNIYKRKETVKDKYKAVSLLLSKIIEAGEDDTDILKDNLTNLMKDYFPNVKSVNWLVQLIYRMKFFEDNLDHEQHECKFTWINQIEKIQQKIEEKIQNLEGEIKKAQERLKLEEKIKLEEERLERERLESERLESERLESERLERLERERKEEEEIIKKINKEDEERKNKLEEERRLSKEIEKKDSGINNENEEGDTINPEELEKALAKNQKSIAKENEIIQKVKEGLYNSVQSITPEEIKSRIDLGRQSSGIFALKEELPASKSCKESHTFSPNGEKKKKKMQFM